MYGKTQIVMPKSIIFGVSIGVILGVTTGLSTAGIWGAISMIITGCVGFSVYEYRKNYTSKGYWAKLSFIK